MRHRAKPRAWRQRSSEPGASSGWPSGLWSEHKPRLCVSSPMLHFRPSGSPRSPALTPHLRFLYAMASLTSGAGIRQILAAIRMGLVFNIHIIHLATGCPFPNSGPQQQSQCVTYQLRVTPKLYIPVPGLGHSWGSTDDAFAVSVMDVSANPRRSDAKMQLSKGRGEHGGYSFGVRVPSSLRSSLLRSLVHMLCGRWEIRRLKCSLGALAAPLVQGQPRVFCPRSWAV